MEENVYFQEKMLSELNEALQVQQKEIDELEKKVSQCQAKIAELEFKQDDGFVQTLPPHSIKY